MTGLDIFALIVLFVLFAVGFGLWLMLGLMPGRIAKSRNHSQVEAVNVCGWLGAITMGILSPVAFIWAYYVSSQTHVSSDAVTDKGDKS